MHQNPLSSNGSICLRKTVPNVCVITKYCLTPRNVSYPRRVNAITCVCVLRKQLDLFSVEYHVECPVGQQYHAMHVFQQRSLWRQATSAACHFGEPVAVTRLIESTLLTVPCDRSYKATHKYVCAMADGVDHSCVTGK